MWQRILTKILLLSMVRSTLTNHALPVNPATICPPSEIIEPCVCSKDCMLCFASILCEDISDQELLSRILDESSDYQFASLFLQQSSFMYIPDSIFKVQKMRNLAVVESSLVALFGRTPSVESLIHRIFLQNVQIRRGLQWELLSGFGNLKYLAMLHMHVPKIGPSFVRFVPKGLVELKINYCSTSRIQDDAFALFPDLLEVYVMNGKIKEVKRSMFPTPSKLKVFSFSGNQLSFLPKDIFSEMPYLKFISLTRNFLKEMPESIFGPVFPNLHLFHIDENPIHCRCNISWITVSEKRLSRWDFDGSCQEPRNLHGKELRDLVHGDFIHCG